MDPLAPVYKYALIALGLALALSLAANGVLVRSYLGVRDERTEATGQRDQARLAANACSASVDALQTAAVVREAENGELRAQAQARARTSQDRAQQILLAPPAVPGDDCKSAAAAADSYLRSRRKP